MSSPEKKRFLKLAKRHGFGRERRKRLGLRFKDIRATLSDMDADGSFTIVRALPRKERRQRIAEMLRNRLRARRSVEFAAVEGLDPAFWEKLLAFLKMILPLLLLFL